MNKFICRVSYCNYPEGQCLEGCDQICPLMRMLEPPTEQEPPAEQPAGPDAEPAIPPGYKLVPVEPTPAMLVAINWPNDPAGYRAMLAAAPEAPQPARQPLIADEICDSWEFITGHHRIQFGPNSEGRYVYLSPDEVIEFARAIERAHGIGEHE